MNEKECFDACNDSKCVRARKCMGLASGSNASSQRSFADKFSAVEGILDGGEYPPMAWTAELLACIREQRAALESALSVSDPNTEEADAARAVLARWRIE